MAEQEQLECYKVFEQEVCAVLREEPNNKLKTSHFRKAYKRKFKRKLKARLVELGGKNLTLPCAVKKLGDSITLTQESSAQYIQLKMKSEASKNEAKRECNELWKGSLGSPNIGKPEVRTLVSSHKVEHVAGSETDFLNHNFGAQSPTGKDTSFWSLQSDAVASGVITSPEDEIRRGDLFNQASVERPVSTQLDQHQLVISAIVEDSSKGREIESLRNPGKAGPFEKALNDCHKIVSHSSLERPRKKRPTLPQINEATQRIIREIAEKGKLVLVEAVKTRLCHEFAVRALSDLGYHKPELQIDSLNDLIKLQSKVNLYIHAYVMVHSISTLHELSQSLPSLEGKEDFCDLYLGPLVKQPAVYNFFKFPCDQEVPPVTTIQVLRQLKKYMEQEDLWSKKVDLKKFMEYLCEEFRCQTPYELGIRIQSIGLAISVYKKSKRSESEKWKHARQQVEEDLERDIQKTMHKMRKELLGEDGDLRSLVQKLQSSAISDIILETYKCCENLLEGRNKAKVQTFLKMLTSDKQARRLFELAIHTGCRGIIEPIPGNQMDDQDKKQATSEIAQTHPPKEGDIVKEVEKWLAKAHEIDLARLSRIEEQVTGCFPGFDDFQSLGFGPFLQFILDHKELREAVEEYLKFLPGGKDGGSRNDKRQVPLDELLDFMGECGVDLPPAIIEEGLRIQYGIHSVNYLGFSSLEKLIGKFRPQNIGDRVPKKSRTLVYEAVLVVREKTAFQPLISSSDRRPNSPQVGALGWKDRQAVLQAIASAPLLADLTTFTRWKEVFYPMFGDLKTFLRTEGVLSSAVNQTPGERYGQGKSR